MSVTTSRPASRSSEAYSRRFFLSALVGVALTITWYVTIDFVFRSWLHVPYHRWYLKNGALISLAFAFATAAWSDLNRLTGLVALHPVRYFGECAVLLAYPFLSMAVAFAPTRDLPAELAPGRSAAAAVVMLARLWDTVMTAALAFIMTVGLLLWLVVVAPAQWAVNVVAGATARSMLRSPMTAALRVGDREWTFVQAPRGSTALEGTTPSGYAQRPVSTTNAFGAVVLWLLSLAGL